MKSLNSTLLDKISELAIKRKIIKDRVSPKYSSVYNDSIKKLDTSMDIENIPSIGYRSELRGEEYTEKIDSITALISTVAKNLEDLESEHTKNVDKHGRLESKIRNSIDEFRRSIDILSNFSCYRISELSSKQTSTSQCGKIGKYITLPFFIGDVKMYKGRCSIRVTSSSELTFSNTDSITRLPSDRLPSLKISSRENTINLGMTISLEETESNMVFIKFENDVHDGKISFLSAGQEVFSKDFLTNEILVNYKPITFDTISINGQFFNQNTDKPLSIKVSDIKIFSNIMFAKTGSFESAPEKLRDQSLISAVAFNYASHGDTQSTMTNPLVSISAAEDEIKYNIIDLNEDIDVSLSKYRYNDNFAYTDLTTTSILGQEYKYKMLIPESRAWDAEFKNSVVLYGINDHALDAGVSTKRFENWTLSNNYWKTSILNYEDNVYVDIKEKTCLVNGREMTGKIKIPTGITNIDVHVKDLNFNGVDLNNKATVSNPYNLAYAFTGLPEYPVAQKLKSFSVDGTTTVSINEAFMPFSEVVTDEFDNPYKLSLTKMPYTPGTYSIEPYHGLIRVYPYEGIKNIRVMYYKASQVNKPCGILFNRLLTFTSLPNVLANRTKDDTLFTFAGTETERFIILPSIPNITNSQMLYNTSSDGLFFSAQVQLETTNNYLTPIIDTMTLSVK